jgi:hypothetical protein
MASLAADGKRCYAWLLSHEGERGRLFFVSWFLKIWKGRLLVIGCDCLSLFIVCVDRYIDFPYETQTTYLAAPGLWVCQAATYLLAKEAVHIARTSDRVLASLRLSHDVRSQLLIAR